MNEDFSNFVRVLKLQDSDGQPINKEIRSERVKNTLKCLTMPTDETESTISKYYLTALKNAKGINWIDEMEEWYRTASMDFLTREDIEGDNILHVFARKRKPGTVRPYYFQHRPKVPWTFLLFGH